MNTNNDKITIPVAARQFHLSAAWLRRLCQKGRIPSWKVGARFYLVDPNDVAAWIANAPPPGRPKRANKKDRAAAKAPDAVKDTSEGRQMIQKEQYPRVTALVICAVTRKRLTPNLMKYIAKHATPDDLQYDIVRVIVGGNPALAKAVQEEAEFFLKEMNP